MPYCKLIRPLLDVDVVKSTAVLCVVVGSSARSFFIFAFLLFFGSFLNGAAGNNFSNNIL